MCIVYVVLLANGEAHITHRGPRVINLPVAFPRRIPHMAYSIKVNGNHLGVLFLDEHSQSAHLVIWNWKAGEIEMVTLASIISLSPPEVGNAYSDWSRTCKDKDCSALRSSTIGAS